MKYGFLLICTFFLRSDGGQICRNCNHVVSPEDCGNVIRCGGHEECYTRHYTTSDGISWYDVGCADSMKCGFLSGFGKRQNSGEVIDKRQNSGEIIDKRQNSGEITVCEQCCNKTALCNTQMCGGHSGSTSPSGPVCFACQDESAPNRCDQIQTCSPYEKCYLKHSRNTHSGRFFWSSGCISDQTCNTYQHSLSTWPYINYCCHGDLCNDVNRVAQECSDIQPTVSGVYTIYPQGMTHSVHVYCLVDSSREVWTVIQKRYDGSVDFYRNWTEYKHGFGNPHTEYWLGNDLIHTISTNGPHKLKVLLTDWNDTTKYAQYGGFSIDDEHNLYRLHVSNYTGTAGDSLVYHANRPFSTYDKEHDAHVINCAARFHGAWWFYRCHSSDLNGLYRHGHNTSYATGLDWYYSYGYYYSLKGSVMMINKA